VIGQLQLTAVITMLKQFVNDIIVFAPFVLPQNNWSFSSGKTNGVMPAHVRRHVAATISALSNNNRREIIQ
jgi:hypothetical protein